MLYHPDSESLASLNCLSVCLPVCLSVCRCLDDSESGQYNIKLCLSVTRSMYGWLDGLKHSEKAPYCLSPIAYIVLILSLLYNWLSVCLSICLSVCLSVCLTDVLMTWNTLKRLPIAYHLSPISSWFWVFSIIDSLSVCLSVCLSVYRCQPRMPETLWKGSLSPIAYRLYRPDSESLV